MSETTIAIADPHPVLCEGFAAYLETLPEFRVIGVTSSPQRISALVSMHQPEVLVLDSGLGEANDARLIRDIAAISRPPAIVLLKCKEDCAAASASSVMNHGVLGFVLKAPPFEDLASAVHWASKGQMWISPPLLTRLFANNDGRNETRAGSGNKRLATLTDREYEILELMVEGLSHADVARRLHVAVNTIRSHTRNIQTKLNVHSNPAAVALGLDAGMRPRLEP